MSKALAQIYAQSTWVTGKAEAQTLARFVLTLLYGTLMVFIYERLSIYWSYFGFNYTDRPFYIIALSVITGAIPAIFLPARVNNLHRFSAWILYYLVFLPAIIIPVIQGRLPNRYTTLLAVAMVLSAIIFAQTSKLNAKPFFKMGITKSVVIGFALSMFAAGNVYIYIQFRDSFQFVGIEQIYDQRFQFSAEVGKGYAGYVIALLSYAVNPFLIALGLADRRYTLLGIGLAGQLFAFSTLALRSTLLSPLVMIGVFFLFDRRRTFRVMLIPVGLLMLSVLAVPVMADYQPVRSVFDQIVTLIFMRTLYISGAMVGVYADFFSLYPVTYFSHSTVGRLLIDYPYYPLSIGQAVGQYLYANQGFEILEANANFVATDALGSMELYGILIVVPLVVLIFHLLARAAARTDNRIVFVSAVPFLMIVANTSIFSSLITGGGILLVVLLYLWGCAAPSAAHSQDG